MKKSLPLTLLLFFVFLFAQSGEWISINNAQNNEAEISLISSDRINSTIRFDVPGFELVEVETPRGPAYQLILENASPLLEKDAPELLKVTSSVIIPDLAEMDVRVLSSEFTEYDNILIAPSKGNLYRDVDPNSVPYVFGENYDTDTFFPGKIAELRKPYIIRDYRGQTVVVYPFQYNPATQTLRVYHSIEVEVFKVNDNGSNPLVREKMPEKISHEYAAIYDMHFLNNAQDLTDYTPVGEHGNMLIISYGDFIPAVQPLADWRIQTGTPCEIVDVATIGSSTQIKSYIADYYNTNGLTFVLLVGDAQQVPSSYASGDSDNNYAYIVGSDHYPDVFIGRFSAENITHVETQVNRTLTYEQNPNMDFNWFDRATGIASSEGPGDDGEYDYQHIRNINSDLTNFTYAYAAELFDGSQGGNDAPGNPSPATVASEVNTGTTIINYTGHGSTTSWSSSGFSNSSVNGLTNNGMWPFIWSVACVNGNFVGNTCFAEAWLRATNNGEPSGAVATMMSTINQSWNPPMCGQDEMVDVLVETYPGNINRTFGAASMHGCMQMNDEYGSGGNEMTDTWVCFGDPALHVRTSMPQTMEATYMNTLLMGMENLEISANAEGGTACLTEDGNILATGIIEDGTVSLTFPALANPTSLTLTITGFNFLPHINQIDVIPGNMPFLVFDDDHVIDTDGNNNGKLDFGESVTYTIDLHNMGTVDAADVDVQLSVNDPYVTLTDDNEMYELIPAGQTVGVAEGFAMEIAANTPDEHIIDFTLTASDADTSWIIEFQAMAYAPILNIGQLVIDDVVSGNDNGRLDPGETAIIKIQNNNLGHCPAEDVMAYLTSSSPYLSLSNTSYAIGVLGTTTIGYTMAEFEVEVDPAAPDGAAFAHFEYELISGDFIETAEFDEKIGLIFEDWETGDFTKFDWTHGGDQPFELITYYPYEGTYSAKSGSIGDNEESSVSISVDVMLPDSVTFVLKTSSQINKDFLKFYINNSLQGEWSGFGGWQRVSIPVEPGSYTFKWVYKKDGSGMSGSDCAWIDFITFPPLMTLTCFAGPDDYICDQGDYQCTGEATNYVSVEWTTSGDGSFNDTGILDPVYTPGTADIQNGSVVLTMTAEDPDGATMQDDMTLELLSTPEAPATPEGPDAVNLYTTTTSDYTTEALASAGYYMWSVEPQDAGTISGTGTTGTIEWNPLFQGTATIAVKAGNSCGEGEFSQGFDVTVDIFTSVAEMRTDSEFQIWPNPGKGYFNVKASVNNPGNYNIHVYSLTGIEMILATGMYIDDEQTIQIDLSSLSEGIYFIVMEGESEKLIQKLVVTK